MSLIESKNIYKSFVQGDTTLPVLRGISLTIEPGEFVGIMGKSGAGKSTLLYQLSGLDQPTSGEILIQGTNITTMSEEELETFRLHTLGYVFQDYALVQDLSVSENVLFPLLMRGIKKTDALTIAHETLGLVGLNQKYNSLPTNLSGGEQQRIAIARAIAGKPKILFADEPTANLDSTSGRSIIDLFTALHKKGQTIVMVTHELEYTANCSRLITLEDGMIISDEQRSQSIPSSPATPPTDTSTTISPM